jgi:Tfp pilus assembly protein FimT
MVIITAVGLPVLTTTIARRQAESAAERVVADLREWRSTALRLGITHRMHSGNDGTKPGEYRLEWTDPVTAQVRTGQWYNLSADYRGGTLGPIVDSGGATQNWIAFSPQGTTTSRFDITVTAQNRTRTVRVERNGNVAVLP